MTKTETALSLLSRAEGATAAEISLLTGWSLSTVPVFISATVKKKLGHNVTSAKVNGVRTYHIVEATAPAVAEAA